MVNWYTVWTHEHVQTHAARKTLSRTRGEVYLAQYEHVSDWSKKNLCNLYCFEMPTNILFPANQMTF